jgi:hypothetical protein
MEYKQFIVQAFEHQPEKWRASVERVDRKALMAMTNRRKLFKFITGVDAQSAQDAVLMAIAAIDAGTFAMHPELDAKGNQRGASIRPAPR